VNFTARPPISNAWFIFKHLFETSSGRERRRAWQIEGKLAPLRALALIGSRARARENVLG
jgi:hypothetical protein